MLPRLAAVVQDVGVLATGFFKGVCQDRQAVEDSLIVDGASHSNDGGRQPSRIDTDRSEGVAENITQYGTLLCLFSSVGNSVVDPLVGFLPDHSQSCLS